MDMNTLLFVSIAIFCQVEKCFPTDSMPPTNQYMTSTTSTTTTTTTTVYVYPSGTPASDLNASTSTIYNISPTSTATPTPNILPTSSTTQTPNILATFSITTTPNILPTSATTPTPNISTFTISATTTTTTTTTTNATTTAVSTGTSQSTTNYLGYLLLNSTVAGTPPLINQTELERWLKLRTDREFRITMFNQGNSTRKKRNVYQTSYVTFGVGTNSSDFEEAFKSTTNNSLTSTIRNYTVEKAFLWLQSKSGPCPDPSTCESGKCRISDNGAFYCDAKENLSGGNNNNNLLGLIAIPCIIVFILLIILVVILVRRSRKEKLNQYITKIHPAAITKKDEYVDTATKRSIGLEGFNSVKSSNFEYENEKVETGLY